MQINAVKFRTSQSEDPITYKFSQSNGKFANFQCLNGSQELLRNLAGAIEFALTGTTNITIFDTVVQASDPAGNTWIIHRTLSKIRIVKNGAEQKEDGLAALHAAFFEHLDDAVPATEMGRHFAFNKKKIVHSNGQLIALDPEENDAPGADIRSILEEQIAVITQSCVEHTGNPELTDPSKMIRLSQIIEPIYAGYREVCSQYKELKKSKFQDPEAHAAEIASLETQLAIIKDLERVAEKYLTQNTVPGRPNDDLAVLDGQIAELKSILELNNTSDKDLQKELARDFRKPVEAIARLEVFARLVRASQGARKYCEQKIEPLYKKYLESADRNLAGNRQIAAELESCLSTLALRLKADTPQPRESGQSLKNWFEKFKTRAGQEELASHIGATTQNDFDTARLAIEYAITQLNDMAGHLKTAVTKHDSALVNIDEAHEALIAQYNQFKEHWVTTARAAGLPIDIDSSQMIKIIVAHGRLASLIERRNELVSSRKSQDNDIMQIEDLVIRWLKVSGSQKHPDLSSAAILIREARDILRYKDVRSKRLEQLRSARDAAAHGLAIVNHLKTRRDELIQQWDQSFAELGMQPPAINDRYNRELLKRAGIVRGLALAWSAASGSDKAPERTRLFAKAADHVGVSTFDCSNMSLDQNARIAFLQALEESEGNELRLLLISDEQLAALAGAMSIGTISRVVQAPAPTSPQAKQARPTPVTKIIRAPQQKASTPVRQTPDLLSERAKQMLEILSPRK